LPVILVLGTCPKFQDPNIVEPHCRTEKIIAALQMMGYRVLLIDLRKTCRRDRTNCRSFDNDAETNTLLVMTALEILVAIRHFQLNITSIISFAEPWSQQFTQLRKLLKADAPQLFTLPHLHIDKHLAYIGTPPQRVSPRVAKSLASQEFRWLAGQLSDSGIYEASAKVIYGEMQPKLADLGLVPWNEIAGLEGKVVPESPHATIDAFVLKMSDPDFVPGAGVPGLKRPSIGKDGQPRKRLQKSDWESMKDDILARDARQETASAIAAALDVSKSTLEDKLMEWRGHKGKKPVFVDWESKKDDILARLEKGESKGSIAKGLGCSKETLGSHLRAWENGVKLGSRAKYRR